MLVPPDQLPLTPCLLQHLLLRSTGDEALNQRTWLVSSPLGLTLLFLLFGPHSGLSQIRDAETPKPMGRVGNCPGGHWGEGRHPLLNKSEVKVSLYLLPFWRYKRFDISGCELSLTTSGRQIDSRYVLFESSYPN